MGPLCLKGLDSYLVREKQPSLLTVAQEIPSFLPLAFGSVTQLYKTDLSQQSGQLKQVLPRFRNQPWPFYPSLFVQTH